MYYSSFEKIKRMERMLERLAYLSVMLDFFVAVATFFVIRGAAFSSTMLMLGGYLMLVEIVIAVVLLISLVVLKHYRKLIDGVALVRFRKHALGRLGLLAKIQKRLYLPSY
jgi:uncharacterized membrane protein